MNKFIFLVPAFALVYLFSSCHHSAHSELTARDIKFIKKAREADLAGIKAAQIAVEHSKSPRVVAFAKLLMSDYNDALSKIKDIKIESPADSISPAHQQYLAKIGKLTGSDFDRAYMNGELDNTQRTLMVYVDGMQDRKDTLFTYAEATAQAVLAQTDSAKKITASLK
jgi:putative membrane protein